MIKNRTVQLIFYTIYCTLGLVGCIASLGIFDNIIILASGAEALHVGLARWATV